MTGRQPFRLCAGHCRAQTTHYPSLTPFVPQGDLALQSPLTTASSQAERHTLCLFSPSPPWRKGKGPAVCSDENERESAPALSDGPFLTLPSPQGTLDGLLCSDDDERDSAAMLHEASRVLVPGGMCLLISFGPPATRAEFICAPSLRWRVQVYIITRRLRIRDPDLGVSSAAVSDLDPLDPCRADGPDLDPSRVESSLEFIVSVPVGVAVGEDGELLLRQLPSGTGPVDPVDPAGLRGGGGGETPLAPPGAVGSSGGVVTQLQFPMNSSTLYA